ncbi:MAG: LamG domain-containing protein, partial [Bacteroidetes bacterium]
SWMFIAAMVSFAACSKDDDDPNDDNGNGDEINPADTVAINNLVAYFKFDGDVTDEQGHEVVSEDVTFTLNRHFEANSAYKGSETAFIKIDDTEKFRMGSMTFSMWLRAQQMPGGTNFILSFIDPDMDWNAGYAIWQEGSGRGDTLRYKAVTRHQTSDIYGWTDTDDGLLRNVFFPPSKWFHFVYAYDGASSIRNIYLDGAKLSSDTLIAGETPMGPVTVPASATSFYIGKNPNTVHEWLGNYKGDLDDLRIFNVALTEEQVQIIYEAEKPE